MTGEYQPRTGERLIEMLQSESENPRSWQREAADEIVRLRTALKAARGEIEWWVEEHGCCNGHQDTVIAAIDAALNEQTSIAVTRS